MKFRVKMTLCMLGLVSLIFGIGGSLLITGSFQNAMKREKDAAYSAFQATVSTTQIVWESSFWNVPMVLEELYQNNAGMGDGYRIVNDVGLVQQFGEAAQYIPEYDTQPEPGFCTFDYREDDKNTHYMILSGTFIVNDVAMYLDVIYDISEIYEARNSLIMTYLWVYAFMAMVCVLLSYWVSGRLMDRDILELKQSVERQERFMGSFAHEMKTPMTSIIGYAEMLCSEDLSQEEREEAAGYIFSEGKRLETLSRKMLQMMVVKKGNMTLVPVQPSLIIEEMMEKWKPVYHPIQLTCKCEEGLCMLEPDLFQALVLNLMDNARKAVDEHGEISVELKLLPDGCELKVIDNGFGIPADSVESLTQAFYRVDKSRSRELGGVGLGLSLCQEIVTFHHGNLWFESEPGKGTCVTVELKGGRV